MTAGKRDAITIINQTGGFTDPTTVDIELPFTRFQLFYLFEQHGTETLTVTVEGKSVSEADTYGIIHTAVSGGAANPGQFWPLTGLPGTGNGSMGHIVAAAKTVRFKFNFTGTIGTGTKVVLEAHPFRNA